MTCNFSNNNLRRGKKLNTKTEHIKWLDGFKAIACLGVFMHHFFGAFYPAYHTGNNADTRLYGIDAFLCNNPLGIIINGNFWVCIFLAISAYVIAIQIMKSNAENLRKKAGQVLIKRYFRLAIPMLFIAIIDWGILFIATKFDMAFTPLRLDKSFFKMLWTYLISIWIYPDAGVFAHLWSMHYLFRAAFVVVLFGIFDRKETKYASIIYAILIYPLLVVNECYISIMMGLILADLTYFDRINQITATKKSMQKILSNKMFKIFVSIIFLLIGIYLGGFPSNTAPIGVYAPLTALDNRFPFFSGYLHGFSTFFILGGLFILNSTLGKIAFLESKVLMAVNKYSLAIYMIHGFFIIYFCQNVYMKLMPLINNYNLVVLSVFVITVSIVLLLSVLFNKTVERLTNYICSKF